MIALAVLTGCHQRPTSYPGATNALLNNWAPESHYDEAFTPVSAQELAAFRTPEAEPYRLGKGDTISVQVMGATSANGAGYDEGVKVRVKSDGTIRLPKVKERIQVEGLTALQVEDMLVETIAKYVVREPLINIEVLSFEARRFFVVGQVTKPGKLPANGKTTVLEALLEVGGTNEETADLEEAYVIRQPGPPVAMPTPELPDGVPPDLPPGTMPPDLPPGTVPPGAIPPEATTIVQTPKVIPISIRDIVMRGHPAGRLVMQEHDILFVPHIKDRADFVYVFGEVATPKRVPMDHLGPPGSGGNLTLAAAIAESGGLNERANINSITVYRGGWKCPQRFRISQLDMYRHGHDIHLRPGDRVAVGTSDTAQFSDALAPSLQVLGASTSALSLALSAVALAK